jgi:hypothetical protein
MISPSRCWGSHDEAPLDLFRWALKPPSIRVQRNGVRVIRLDFFWTCDLLKILLVRVLFTKTWRSMNRFTMDYDSFPWSIGINWHQLAWSQPTHPARRLNTLRGHRWVSMDCGWVIMVMLCCSGIEIREILGATWRYQPIEFIDYSQHLIAPPQKDRKVSNFQYFFD